MRSVITCTLLLAITFTGCNKPVDQKSKAFFVAQEWSGPTPWTDTPLLNDPEEFEFAVISDIQGGNRRAFLNRPSEK